MREAESWRQPEAAQQRLEAGVAAQRVVDENDTTELVSNSVVFLNGVQVLGPGNFNQSVAEVNVTIFPGLTNMLSVPG